MDRVLSRLALEGKLLVTKWRPQAPDGQSAAEGCQKQAVGREQVWSLDLAAEDGDLMPQGQQFEIALGLRLSVEQKDGHQQPRQSIDGCEEHEPAR